MGRTQESYAPLAQQAHRKDQRAKRARQIINKTIPHLLVSNARARNGVANAELIIDPQQAQTLSVAESEQSKAEINNSKDRKKKSVRRGKGSIESEDEVETIKSNSAKKATLPQTREQTPIQVSISVCDTLFAARQLSEASPRSKRNVTVLNMASPLRPGGGVLKGATSQEETLCTRTTLLPSLKEEWYRLPELGGIWSPDVLVFEDDAEDKTKRFYVDVISSAMMRLPDLAERPVPRTVHAADMGQDEAESAPVEHVYANEADREMAVNKIRTLLRILQSKGAENIVLGAWGCGAYANPVDEIVRAFRKVLFVNNSRRNGKNKVDGSLATEWTSFREIVFAIKDAKMAASFANAWGNDIEVDYPQKRRKAMTSFLTDEQNEIEKRNRQELQEKIEEKEIQIGKALHPELREGLGRVLEGLRKQLNLMPERRSQEEKEEGVDLSNDDRDGHDENDNDQSDGQQSKPVIESDDVASDEDED